MRPELENIQRIEQYLDNTLTPADRAAFEAQLTTDPNLREELRLQQDLRSGLRRIDRLDAIRKAKRHYNQTTWLRRGGLGLGVLIIAAALTVLIFSPKDKHKPIHRTSTTYTVNLNRDTILKTEHGALLNIPRASISSGNDTIARLSVIEAYNIADIVRNGLTTQSNGQPLSSGGMIDIEPVGNARLVHPITISLPTNHLDKNMRLYKGITADNGTINWADPQPLPKSNQADTSNAWLAGRNFFQTNCAQCHSITGAVTGPPLAYLAERRPREWTFAFIRNNQRVLASGDCYSSYIFNLYGKTPMNIFPTLTDRDIDQLLLYIETESRYVDSNLIPNYTRQFDSCRQYKKMAAVLLQNREALIGENGVRTNVIRRDDTGALITDTTIVYTTPAPVRTVEHPSIYYTFTVESFGWYNVDALLKELPGIEPSELKVRMSADYAAEVNVFLVIPGRMIYTEGGFLKDSKTDFGFLTEDGQIPLPQGEQAYVFATGEYRHQPAFAIKRFTIGRQQTIDLQPSMMTKEQITGIIDHLDLNKLSIRVADSRNAAKIRAVDTSLAAIERFKPQNCDCNCEPNSGRDTSIEYIMVPGASGAPSYEIRPK
jgi:mono/diheme cytochrome c family protein